jgi:hypothetical protein
VVAAGRRRALAGLAGGGLALCGVLLAVFGSGLWHGAVRAQLQVGRASLHYVGGLIAQGGWNELPLLAGAALALAFAARTRDPALLRTLAAAALGGLLLAFSLFKRGSYINVLAVSEPPLLALAACGFAWAWERRRVLVLACGAVLAAQAGSLLASPGDPLLARRPFARSGLERARSPAAVDRAVAAARRCPRGLAYSGVPYIAFLAERRMPGGQPDLFMLRFAAADRRFALRAATDQPRCPT